MSITAEELRILRESVAEAGERSRDEVIFEGFGLDHVDLESLAGYRNLFLAAKPGHPWLALDNQKFLERLGGYRRDPQSGAHGLTQAGLLMFGQLHHILAGIGYYLVDYQEQNCQPGHLRYNDRITTDGTWSGNLFDFFRRVYPKLVADLKIPFAYRPGTTQRIDETPVHEALREALVNSLIHADHNGRVGVMIVKKPEVMTFRNPGGLRLPLEVVLEGGVTDCRNRNLQKMFQLIGEGEQAGSGLARILATWKGRGWRAPLLRESVDPPSTLLELFLEGPLPERAFDELARRLDRRLDTLPEAEQLAVVTAWLEGRVDSRRVQELSGLEPRSAALMLRNLVGEGLLASEGPPGGKGYVVPEGG